MRLACAWLAVALCLLSFGGCREKGEERPARPTAATDGRTTPSLTDVTPPPPPAPDGAQATMTEPAPPEVPPADVVPAGDDPWLSYADGEVRAFDASGERRLTEGDAVLPGTLVTAESSVQVEFDLPDGSVVDLDEMTELLVQAVNVRGALRQIELTVFGGAVRVVAAPSEEAASVLRVATPVGVVEVERGDVAVEVDGATGAARIVVLGGRATVQAGAGRRTLEGAGSTPAAAEIAPSGELGTVEVPADSRERWTVWDERQGDRLIRRYRVHIGDPATIESPAFSVDAHPPWAGPIRIRRGRIAARALAFIDALGPELVAGTTDPLVAHAMGHDAWGIQVGGQREELLERTRPERVRQWTARAGLRAERAAALRGAMTGAREAYTAQRPPATPAHSPRIGSSPVRSRSGAGQPCLPEPPAWTTATAQATVACRREP